MGVIHTLNARFDVRAGHVNFITGGYEFESENFKNPSFQVNPADNSDVDVTQRSHALFVQDQLRFMEDRLQISVAFRTQFFRLRQPVFTPTASAPYRASLFNHHPRPTRAMAPSPTCSVRRAQSCVPTSAMAIGRRRFLNALAHSSVVSLVTPSLAIRVLQPDRSIAFDAGLIRHFPRTDCAPRRLTSTRASESDHLRLLRSDRSGNRSVRSLRWLSSIRMEVLLAVRS